MSTRGRVTELPAGDAAGLGIARPTVVYCAQRPGADSAMPAPPAAGFGASRSADMSDRDGSARIGPAALPVSVNRNGVPVPVTGAHRI